MSRCCGRCPTRPAVVGEAVTGLAAGTTASAADVAIARALFETVGTVIEVPESQIDALSTISGSGPAYFFLLVEEFTKAAVGKGFDEAEARVMAEQTFIGAAALLQASDVDPRSCVAASRARRARPSARSPCCRTAHLDEVFAEATDAALARARELAAGG